ncbi:MAG TPA: XRE family transcriptional regulator [Trebonia sp.]|jgi:transcriptional regulator with XRE-family HTH domain
MADETDPALAAVGPRLRALRRDRGTSLADVSAATGISVSTLSRLEAGQRRATLELLLPLARAYRVSLDEIVTAPVADPRVRPAPVKRHGMIYYPLSRRPGGLQAYKLVIPASSDRRVPDPRSHEGYEWLYVLDGRLRVVLGEHDVVLAPGEAAEFDTRVPHWFGAAGPGAVELLSLFGPQGERMHVRARPARQKDAGSE